VREGQCSRKAPRKHLAIDGQTLKFTNCEEGYLSGRGYTKRDVSTHHGWRGRSHPAALKNRPFPEALSQWNSGAFFFQKDAPESFAPWLRTNRSTRSTTCLRKTRQLLYLVISGASITTPDDRWPRRPIRLRADRPGPSGMPLRPGRGRRAAGENSCWMDRLAAYPRPPAAMGCTCTFHRAVYTYDERGTFAELIARLGGREQPDLFTAPRSVAKREEPGLFRLLQNGRSRPSRRPNVLRAYPGRRWRLRCNGAK